MAEYGTTVDIKKVVTRKPPLVVFGISFGESSYLDYEPDRKLKVKHLC